MKENVSVAYFELQVTIHIKETHRKRLIAGIREYRARQARENEVCGQNGRELARMRIQCLRRVVGCARAAADRDVELAVLPA